MGNREGNGPNQQSEIPRAKVTSRDGKVARRWLATRMWWVTAASAVVAAVLVIANLRNRGKEIVVEFQQGHGLEPGAALRYRGIDVGQVEHVGMTDDLQKVQVVIRLAQGHEAIAVEGSEFWIVRPQIRLGQFRGLDTVVGARYVEVVPGPRGAPPANRFVGRESPLQISDSEFIDIHIRFPAGEGLAVGDQVRYRGIVVGEVTSVKLDETLEHVWVDARLIGTARGFARAGTQFWIERPRLDLTEVRGLETLVAGRYIGVEPSGKGAVQTEFEGLAAPPPLPRKPGSLEIELDAPRRFGLVRGAPVRYRDIEVGRVSNVKLSDDAAFVKVIVVIDPKYTSLVRTNSRWWVVSGVRLDAGIRQGVRVSIDSLSAWLRGGIAFATPEQPGEKVSTGHKLVLEPEPSPEWLQWRARIDLERLAESDFPLPRPVLVTATLQSRWFGLPRDRNITGWALPLSDGRLLLPAQLLKADEDGMPRLEMAGAELIPDHVETDAAGRIAWIRLPEVLADDPWPVEKVRGDWDGKSVLLIVNQDLDEPMPIDASSVKLEGDAIKLVQQVSLAPRFQGSAVLDGSSGKLAGLLVQEDGNWYIIPVP